jgi:hypothetical protein
MTVYCRAKPVYEARYEPSTNASPVEAVAKAVAEVEGVDPMALPPLYDHVDVEAMNRLLARESDCSGFVFGFTVGRWHVFVRGDGRIRVFDGETESGSTPVFDSNTPTENAARSQSRRPATTD